MRVNPLKPLKNDSDWIARFADSDWQTQLIQAYSKKDDSQLLRVTPYYASLIDFEDPLCPIGLQSLPSHLENDPVLSPALTAMSRKIFDRPTPWTPDAIGDLTRLVAPRLTHRYHNRAILHVSATCAMYCRFCFRKSHLTHKEASLYEGDFEPAFAYLKANPQIRELILTGGDPLSLNHASLEKIFSHAKKVGSLEILRIHTRMPVTLPARIDDHLCSLLSHASQYFSVQLVTHFNHPKELTPTARSSIQKLRQAGVQLFNQSVLLKHVNANPQTLVQLFNTLDTWGVRPYYLHHPDYTPNTFGFRTTIAQGRAIYRSILGRVSGPALPHYILDLPGGKGKIPLLDTANVEWVQSETAPQENALEAHVYRIKPPETRIPSLPHFYLDLAFKDSNLSAANPKE